MQTRSQTLTPEIEAILAAHGWEETKGYSFAGPKDWSCAKCSFVEVQLNYLGEQICALDQDERIITFHAVDRVLKYISFTRNAPVSDNATCLDGVGHTPTTEEDYDSHDLDNGGWRTFPLSEYDDKKANEDVRFELLVGINKRGEASYIRIVRYDRIKTIFGRMIAQLEGQLDPKEFDTLVATYNFALGVGKRFD